MAKSLSQNNLDLIDIPQGKQAGSIILLKANTFGDCKNQVWSEDFSSSYYNGLSIFMWPITQKLKCIKWSFKNYK